MLSMWVFATILLALCVRVTPLIDLIATADIRRVDGWSWPVQLILLGALPVLLSAVSRGYKSGVRLHEEQELTI
jgi:hypothetical protein